MKSKDSWSILGDQDPYYGVLTDEKYRSSKLDKDVLAEFYNSGESQINFVMRLLKKFNIKLNRNIAVDFGCGVGRLTLPISKSGFGKVYGVDISEGMLAKAMLHTREMNFGEDIKYLTSLSSISEKVDFVHSYIVLQHIEKRIGYDIISQMAQMLNVEGVIAIHVPIYRWEKPLRRIISFLQTKISIINYLVNVGAGRPIFEPLMQMNIYNLNNIIKILEAERITDIHLVTEHDGSNLSGYIIGVKK